MPVSVPTIDEFTALEARVAALEGPGDGNGGNGTGVLARRIVDLTAAFGVNTFSSMDEHNTWGSWPADYRPESVIAGLRWLVQDSGHTISVREYHYAGRESFQRPWFQQLAAAFPNMRNTICIAANGGVADVPTMIGLQQDASCAVTWVEGINEPNNEFGAGTVDYDVTLAAQTALWNASTRGQVLGPSIVAGMPHPEGWITGYCGGQAGVDALQYDLGNGHYYPPHAPDLPGDDASVTAYVEGLRSTYAAPIALTEFHPSLYNSEGHKPDQGGWDGGRDAYYLLTTLFRCAAVAHSCWWYALLDYGTTFLCGLFPKTGAADPREAAYGLRALCSICGDSGDDARTFEPGRLDYRVTGGDASVSHDLYQASHGAWFIMLWRSLPEAGGAPLDVVVDVPGDGWVEEFDLTAIAENRIADGYAPVQSVPAGRVTVRLDGSCRVLRISG